MFELVRKKMCIKSVCCGFGVCPLPPFCVYVYNTVYSLLIYKINSLQYNDGLVVAISCFNIAEDNIFLRLF